MKIKSLPAAKLSKSFENYASIIEKNTRKKHKIDDNEYIYGLKNFGDRFEAEGQLPQFNKIAKRLAETLVNLHNDKLAGVIYNILIKLNRETDLKLVEDVATKALAIARREYNPVFIAARTNDLKEIYKFTEYGSDRHLKLLREEKRALKEICENYDGITKKMQSISGKHMRPIEKYQEMLAAIRLEIAEVLIKRGEDTKNATEELLLSQTYYSKFPEGHNAKKIAAILKKLSSK
ncbi:hypothetical protein IJ472_06320 [bacterium]|nr:hypothetical protein [bacterium]